MSKRDPLKAYREKRDFRRTAEPSGPAAGGRRDEKPVYVIQKHDASSLHYDFRLEVDGVLASWAVPKGPSTDPREKRLAVRTEDHPLDYADFEGVIPEGEYGAGPVLVWDMGSYRNLRTRDEGRAEMPMAECLEDGLLEVELAGEKLAGGYALKRMRDRDWLLIKMRDAHADARRNPVSTQGESVLSGRTIAEVRKEEGDDD